MKYSWMKPSNSKILFSLLFYLDSTSEPMITTTFTNNNDPGVTENSRFCNTVILMFSFDKPNFSIDLGVYRALTTPLPPFCSIIFFQP